ncbi:type II toxin-antitoxin system RelE/ParE family toxin [Nitrospirillum amazonense]|uniref:type II toxin-antitoxin system RelE/ParE family toxin n=1 Tax=Nitrospirillum amazonense TaxID=28077 RepID=UPI0011AAAA08
MTDRYRLRPAAVRDLEAIWDYTESRWGVGQAETYLRQLWHHLRMLAAQPDLGRSCDEVRPGYYKYPAGSHLLFYRTTAAGIEVVRVLHERMDVKRHL